MNRRAGSYLTAILIVAAIGCSGYADGSSRTEPDAATTSDASPVPEPDSAPPAAPPATPEPPDAGADTGANLAEASSDASTDMTMTPAEAPTEMDASQGNSADAGNDTNLRIARSDRFEAYLTDALDQPLYMFAGDVADSSDSGCLGDCAREWPPFDVVTAKLGPEIDPADVSRFHRQDGAWQTRYKGHPLYYRNNEGGSTQVSSDGVDKRWFVARDYFTFLSTARTFAPAGGIGTNSTFLTDGYGRTLYICLDDRPATGMLDAFSSCDEACTRERPLFVASQGDQTAVLPSTLEAGDLAELLRPDGRTQLTYRGWPLYYFSADIVAGATAGHNERAWRAIDPSSFGREPASTN